MPIAKIKVLTLTRRIAKQLDILYENDNKMAQEIAVAAVNDEEIPHGATVLGKVNKDAIGSFGGDVILVQTEQEAFFIGGVPSTFLKNLTRIIVT